MSPQARVVAAIALLFVAYTTYSPAPPAPPPAPEPTGLSLRGLFVGETAASDAATLAALCDEIAAEIEWDGKQAEPLLKTGVAFDTLRTRAREFRLKGESIGERQPRVADKVAEYLFLEVGDSGGPVEPSQRVAWVAAYRDIAEACRDAIGR